MANHQPLATKMDYQKSTNDTCCTLTLKGKFTFADHSHFKETFNVFADQEINQVMVDLNELSFVDSAALGLFLLMRDEAKKRNKELFLKSPKGQVHKMFEVSRFYELFTVKD